MASLGISLGTAAAGLVGAAYLDAKHSISEDLNKVGALLKAQRQLKAGQKQDKNSIFYVFEQQAIKNPKRECYVCQGYTLTYEEVNLEARRVAHWLLSLGLDRGDCIALIMANKPAFPIIWLACQSINVVPAFINYNLAGDGLAHCVAVAAPKLVLFDADLADNVREVAPAVRSRVHGTKFAKWSDRFNVGEKGAVSGPVEGELSVDEGTLANMSTERIGDERRKGVQWSSPVCYIYTSGTTGLPKAAIVTHGRGTTAMIAWTQINGFDKNSRIYTPMPLYHSTAALLAVATAWQAGSTIVIGRKFSASNYWQDVRDGHANVIQYVGEVLRYLLAVPPSPSDKDHDVKLAYGNGLRPEIWEQFRDRFGVPTISEFFASSEGNGSLFNFNGNSRGAGAVGHEGTLAALSKGTEHPIVKVDPLTEDVYRNKQGWCEKCAADEPGELLLLIGQKPHEQFAGYHEKASEGGKRAATEKKIIRDVFNKGDAYFRTGDLLRRTADGYFFFADRLGDTFRWKSENVATTQVSEALGAVVGEANVYGVLVPSHEGRAGCAAIPRGGQGVDLDRLAAHVKVALPKYAQPLFLRMVDKVDVNGTSKQLKVALRNEGVDPEQVKDDVYWLKEGRYVRFGREDWEALQAGKVKL